MVSSEVASPTSSQCTPTTSSERTSRTTAMSQEQKDKISSMQQPREMPYDDPRQTVDSVHQNLWSSIIMVGNTCIWKRSSVNWFLNSRLMLKMSILGTQAPVRCNEKGHISRCTSRTCGQIYFVWWPRAVPLVYVYCVFFDVESTPNYIGLYLYALHHSGSACSNSGWWTKVSPT